MSLFEFDDNEKLSANVEYIIGTDEAGRGPAAGGVWAAAVYFKPEYNKKLFEKLNDSKKLSAKTREILYETIKESALWSIKAVNIETIEKINILQSALLAMNYAVSDVINQINSTNCLTLVDGNKFIKNFNFKQKFIIKGDSLSASIAAASILAKVSRDKYMDKIDLEYPMYDWKNNKGYLTKKHIEAIKKYGITKYHRQSFLKNIIYKQQKISF